MQKFSYILFLIGVFTANYGSAQEQFSISQYMLHQPFMNPASISSYGNVNGALLYKKQWVGLEGAPEIQAFSINSPFKKGSNSHIGLTAIHDKIGVNNNYNIAATYAYALKTSKSTRLSFSLSGQADILQSNYADIQNLEQTNDLVFLRNSRTHYAPNFQYGMYFYSKKFYAGITIPKLLVNDIRFQSDLSEDNETTFDINQWHYYFSTGYKFELSENTSLIASTLVKHVSGSPLQIDGNVMFEMYKRIGLGVSYRTSNTVVGIFTVNIVPQLKLAYSYDYSFSQLAVYNRGTHEVSLLFDLKRDRIPLHITAPRF